ncbi:ATP-dependent sacrificial sulfur transferase LarE [candidate division NPL-UPA2 bacterium Unc8]|uniref:ATP-dependent sacrificial sulfur transferase LarE n=1 Tax=candidate division NPL-UPA2 bacterium Unc8 TaxID=1980939 RepID=A0A399FXB7_UNCN2|nr:NH(3)-dependent NAD(+) synthetase [Bacillota bacterium]MBT9137884.1 NH(3)-dependent NAD(+) synthetase [Bacillota bacterium]MBT9146744.1 NH(3)-dependent NAD(+) synthetase [Bacillota bacterium]RII01045.1 MAG: ATP-dependent sacrificial sulfur transferase LarE [candidate division NPL-UPA2 bacterium Unc8]
MDKLKRLSKIIGEMKSVLIAYSGGVDSTLLLRVASDVLGEKVLAVTARSALYPQEEHRETKRITAMLEVRQIIIRQDELKIKEIRTNVPQRCYYCKRELFSTLVRLARKEGLSNIADGTNLDDLDDFRPGMKAAYEYDIRSPLREAELTKRDIRRLSRKLNLPTADKPPMACLASRFPYGEEITQKKLKMVEKGEEFLRDLLKAKQAVRVRHHDNNIARIEVTGEEIFRLFNEEARNKVVKEFRKLGYNYVNLDLEGYRSGSMNEVIL